MVAVRVGNSKMSFSSKNLALFYYQLGTLVQAGAPIQKAMVVSQKTAPRAMRNAVAELSRTVNEGTPLYEAMERLGNRFADLDRHAVDMTERSGALDVGLLSLSKHYESRASARRKIISGLAYPICLVVAFVCIRPLIELIFGSITVAQFLWETAGALAQMALACWVASLLLRWSFRVPGLNLQMDRLLLTIPVLGHLRFDYALSAWLSSIRLMLRAGISIVPALERASRTVQSPLISDAYRRAAPLIGGQLEVSRALASTGVFPAVLIQFWETGEQSGKMDEMLDRLVRFYEERWRNSLELTAIWVPRIIYLLIVLNIALAILEIAGSYSNVLNSF